MISECSHHLCGLRRVLQPSCLTVVCDQSPFEAVARIWQRLRNGRHPGIAPKLIPVKVVVKSVMKATAYADLIRCAASERLAHRIH